MTRFLGFSVHPKLLKPRKFMLKLGESTCEFTCTNGSEPRLKPGALSSRRKLPGTCMGDDAFTAAENPTAGRR